MLSIAYPPETDENYDVSFDGLYEDNENIIHAIEEAFSAADVIDHEIMETNYGVKGILYHFTFTQKTGLFSKTDGIGYWFCFPSEEERRWLFVCFAQTNNVSGDNYKNDYLKLISSIREKS